MPKHLTPELVEQIVEILNDWCGKLTWPLVVAAVERDLGWKYTRQTLAKNDDIKDAFLVKKEQLSVEGYAPAYYTPREMKKALDRLDRLEAENKILKQKVKAQAAQLMQWAYNAGIEGITEDRLNSPLPSVDRR
ncbi:hypothetical protein [Pseudodesulfovibrio indicus]|uniref:Transposase n=1 Tax=Pseudodesulfovibrio indicus TaxID=1716143 RepID=A0ABM5YTR9_9BACT|nr:hypothetical protein [Pseudodesulfovibrio indicus]AMK10773.1 hypothetical protein AWY79_06435 [Pseudodesulfovibrio indicus]